LEERRIVQQQLVFPDTRHSPDIAAAAYEAVLPRMHIVFLGVGEDGHVASLFPGHPVQDSVKTVDAVYDSPKPPPRRITVTYRGFPADAAIVLLFFGEGKAEAYRRFHAGAGRDTCPAAYFIDHPNLVIVHNQGSPQ